MSDETSPYGTHEHASPNAVRVHTFVGEPTRLVTLDAAVEGASRATFSTAPYKPRRKVIPPPPPRSEPEPEPEPVMRESALCKYRNCTAARVPGFQYCGRHPPMSGRDDAR